MAETKTATVHTRKIDPLPNHVAVIMDGNGRWAEKRGLPRLFGHRAGTDNVRRVVDGFLAYGVGGIAGPLMGGRLGDLGNFPQAFTICGGAVLIAAVLIAFVGPPARAGR